MSMHYGKEYLQIAAKMLGDGDTGLLNARLADHLEKVSDLCCEAGGQLRSRQIIAAIITSWMIQNPEVRAYGD